MTKYLSIQTVSDNLGVSPKTLRKWIADQKIPAVKMPGKNGQLKISELAVERWIKARTIQTKGASVTSA